MATYSQSVFGIYAGSPFTAKSIEINDAQAIAGAQANAMQTGTAFLCKRPDGSVGYFTLDSQRSTPANPVLIPVGP
jgi:hypothetical protein